MFACIFTCPKVIPQLDMTTLQAPLVSLQAPKEVSIDLIEAELREIWQRSP